MVLFVARTFILFGELSGASEGIEPRSEYLVFTRVYSLLPDLVPGWLSRPFVVLKLLP